MQPIALHPDSGFVRSEWGAEYWQHRSPPPLTAAELRAPPARGNIITFNNQYSHLLTVHGNYTTWLTRPESGSKHPTQPKPQGKLTQEHRRTGDLNLWFNTCVAMLLLHAWTDPDHLLQGTLSGSDPALDHEDCWACVCSKTFFNKSFCTLFMFVVSLSNYRSAECT